MWRFFKKQEKRLILFLLLFSCCFFLIIFVFFYQLPNFGSYSKQSHRPFECNGWRCQFKVGREEENVFRSVLVEHLELLEKLEETARKLDETHKLISLREAELKELEIRIEELEFLRKEYDQRRKVQLRLPNEPIFRNETNSKENAQPTARSLMFPLLEESIDFSRCSISTQFRVFVYPLARNSTKLAQIYFNEFTSQPAHITQNPNEACIYVAILDFKSHMHFKQLKFFNSYGRNHLLVDLDGNLRSDMVEEAMLVSQQITAINHRPTMDITAFLNISFFDPDRWRALPPLLPIIRKYLLSFISNPILLGHRQLNDLATIKQSMDSSQDPYLIDLECPSSSNSTLCYNREERLRIGAESTFTLIFPEDPSSQQRFYESLEAGSIPVICSLHSPLPFDQELDWRLAALRIPPSRFPELHFILRAISTPDLVELKRKGRFYFEHLLADTRVLTRSILSALRFRLQMPSTENPGPTAVPLYKSDYNSAAWNYPSYMSTATRPPYDDEYLGPRELPLDSPHYTHNFTAMSMYSSKLWNEFPFSTAFSPEFMIDDSPLPSDAEFNEDTAFGMRPISPGSGMEFSKALGGNRPREQFTIVIVSYNRDQVLSGTLERLIGLPYLNRVIVIWNDIDRLPSLPNWPQLHVPLLFVNGTRNSLNNRFIPYKEIRTEAVLSMDDDIDLKQYEIIFAFRVWRENRDRIVGFPARYHAHFEEENFYNSNHTCQFSMILTGAAFLHKAFLDAYTFHMPEAIRLKVDEWMNCEDLAMNFLVAHLTRKPPIKTTSKWTLKCPTCVETLSKDSTYFDERHECIRFFTQVYGYNPLLFTQFRADSVLFKTRVPTNHQKCFRYV